MAKSYSSALSRFRTLIESDYKRVISKKRKEEKRDFLEWFVDDCPAQDGPETAEKLADLGICTAYKCKVLKNDIISCLGLKCDDTYKFCQTGSDMEALIDDIEKLYTSRRKAIIFFAKGTYGEMDSLYIRIRNSFAHGNYFKINDYYYLWNESCQKALASFMVLKYDDLKALYKVLGKKP